MKNKEKSKLLCFKGIMQMLGTFQIILICIFLCLIAFRALDLTNHLNVDLAKFDDVCA